MNIPKIGNNEIVFDLAKVNNLVPKFYDDVKNFARWIKLLKYCALEKILKLVVPPPREKRTSAKIKLLYFAYEHIGHRVWILL